MGVVVDVLHASHVTGHRARTVDPTSVVSAHAGSAVAQPVMPAILYVRASTAICASLSAQVLVCADTIGQRAARSKVHSASRCVACHHREREDLECGLQRKLEREIEEAMDEEDGGGL